MIPEVPQIRFEQALKKFDQLERTSSKWKDWLEQPGNEFIIFDENAKNAYPLKHILALATGQKDSEIDYLEALNYAPKHGLQVVSAAKQLERERVSTKTTGNKSVKSKTSLIPPAFVPEDQLFNPALLKIWLARFAESDHKSFTHSFYLEDERNYKVEASRVMNETFGENGEHFKSWIEAKEFEKAFKIIQTLFNRKDDNLLYKPWEILPFLKNKPEPLVNALYELLYGEGAFTTRFQNWIDLLSKINHLCWPAATYHLMLLDPKVHIYVKPGTVGKLIKAVGSKLVWQATTNPAFYAEIQRFARAILKELAPDGATDMIDVQSFSWVMRDYE